MASQTGAREAGLVAAVAARLAEKPAIRARFRETQTLAALKSPLVSTGTLLFVRERGVIWRIDTPYAAAYVIGDAGVARIGANGERAAQAGRSRASAGVAQVSRMMRAMLGGDLSALYAQFDVRATGTPAQWRIELTPNQPQIAQAIDSLQMEGGEFLRSLVIRSASGDITRIDFVDSAVVGAPAAADLALFGAR
ncbi:outer membrane lipoprotein carrier protein LolA [Trinickia sp. EG282A]